MVLAGVPIKRFGVAKKRLAPVLDAGARSRLGKALAARTLRAVAQAGADAVAVTGDAEVKAWAEQLGFAFLDDGGTDLDEAARCTAQAATEKGMFWAIVHADLPVVTAADLRRVFTTATDVIAPSYDGGTNLITGTGPDFAFSHGPGSFHRHLAATPHATVVAHPRLALDLDTPRDLDHALRSPYGRWMRHIIQAV